MVQKSLLNLPSGSQYFHIEGGSDGHSQRERHTEKFLFTAHNHIRCSVVPQGK